MELNLEHLNVPDYYREKPDSGTVKGIFGSTGLSLLTSLMTAKKEGKKLPKLLDKIATLGIKAEKEGTEIGKETAMQKLKENKPLLIVSGIALVLIVILIFK